MRRVQTSWLFSVMLCMIVSCDTTSNVDPVYRKYYIKYFGGDGDNEGIDMVVNPDNTLVILGNSIPQDQTRKIFVTKTDIEGNVIWEKLYGNGAEYPQDIEPTNNGYVILSNIDVGNDQYQFKLIRIDDNGNKIDSLVYDILADQFGRSVTPLSDGGFYVVGNTTDSDPANADDEDLPVEEVEDLLYVRFDNTFVKTNSTEDRVGSSTLGAAIKVYEISPGIFMTSENSNQAHGGEDDDIAANFEQNFIFRFFTNDATSPAGAILYLGSNIRQEYMNQSVRSSDGFIYSIGTSVASSSSIIYVSKTANIGDDPVELFENTIDLERMEGVSISPGIGFSYVLGNKVSEADGTRDIWLTKISSSTGLQHPDWLEGVTFGTSTNDDSGSVVAEMPDGDILILGTMTLTNQKKIALIKLSPDGKFVP